MPANSVALVVMPAPARVDLGTFDEQASTVSPGNKFDDDGVTMLYVRNTTASAITVNFLADLINFERTIASASVPGSGTEGGVLILGPFPKIFTDHSVTASADNGKVFVKQASGTDGQLQFCPFRVNPNLRSA